ncbi:MAG: response regulator transcription factor [Acidobacteria bacterium]|nr:response regulator transcription factor [Acidobacteriota bacterium]
MLYRILLIEDEPGLVLTLSDKLAKEGYDVVTALDGEEGFIRASSQAFDLIILDLMLPKKSGLNICRDLRQQGFLTPVIMLTARDQVVDKVLGLKIGADDYLTKPFEMLELMARIEALLRRATRTFVPSQSVYKFGSVQVDLRKTVVTRNGEPVLVAAKEFQLLRYLIDHEGKTLSREKILQEVWGYTAIPSTRTVDVHIAWIRQKLEEDPRHPKFIITVHGLGYKFTP